MRKNMHVSLDLSSVNAYSYTVVAQRVYKIVVQLLHVIVRYVHALWIYFVLANEYQPLSCQMFVPLRLKLAKYNMIFPSWA